MSAVEGERRRRSQSDDVQSRRFRAAVDGELPPDSNPAAFVRAVAEATTPDVNARAFVEAQKGGDHA